MRIESCLSFCYNIHNDAFTDPGGAALILDPEIPASERPTLLATFEYSLAFSPPELLPPDEWLEGFEEGDGDGNGDGDGEGDGEGEEFEVYHAGQLWRQRSALRYLVAQETGRRLDERYHGLVSPQVEVRRGSLLVAVSLMLAAGVPLASFITQFPDFMEGLGLLKAALGQDVVRAAETLSARDNPSRPPQIGAIGATRFVNQPEPAAPPAPEPSPPSEPSELAKPASPPPAQALRPIFGPPRVSIFKRTLRVLVLLFGFFFLLSEFQATRDLLSGFVSIPDLRHQTVYLLDFRAASPGPSERLLFKVSNQGIGPARDVLARLRIEEAAILEYQVLGDELHRVEAVNLKAGELDLWLERLASGAELQLYVVTDQPVHSGQIRFSTASERGLGHALPADFFPGSWQGYRNQVLIAAANPSEFTLWARQAGLAQFWEGKYLPWAVLVAAGLIFLTWLFVDGLAALVVGLPLTFLVSWIFVDATVPAGVFIVTLTLSLVLVVWTSFLEFTPLDRDVNDFIFWVIDEAGCYLIPILAALLAGLVFLFVYSIGKRVPEHWLVAVLGGLVFYYLIGLALEDIHRRGRRPFQ
jgi:hypothetical protein